MEKNNHHFEKLYLKIRKKERRIYSHDQIHKLPYLEREDANFEEWKFRANSLERFLKYYATKKWNHVLDLGCGNGWFLNRIFKKDTFFTGVEINELELEQAKKIHIDHENVNLINVDIFSIFEESKYDLIIMNASVQYFKPLSKIIKRLLFLLDDRGEIHIIDSPFYPNEKLANSAKLRSKEYFDKNGVSGLLDFYSHHCIKELQTFNHEILFDPHTFKNKFLRKLGKSTSPLFWIKILK